ncbi:MAG TPA: hypothetical protein VH189_15910 [Rhizomicrobium sp.]|nr:hypothetical protein [Rhizomicrobium sp.]
MVINRIPALVMNAALLWLGLPAAGLAFPDSYVRRHPDHCAEARQQNTNERLLCADRAWCAQHRDDNRQNRIACDPYTSNADRRLPSFAITQAGLNASPALSEAEMHSDCHRFNPDRADHCTLTVLKTPAGGPDYALLPAEMKSAKLAMRADLSVSVFPVTVARLGISGTGSGWMELTWNVNGKGPRQTRSIRLTPAEVDHLLVALNKSDFWRLPRKFSHRPIADGETAAVEVAAAGRKAHVMDSIGGSDAVDLSVLVNAISLVIRNHWPNVPGG